MTTTNSSISKSAGLRDSNMELLRIVAMLLVCVIHANFRALPIPTYEEAYANVSSSILRFFTESLSVICVNLFILLSGWYGIKFKFNRLIDFISQVFFFSILCAGIYYGIHPEDFSIKEAIGNILLTDQWDYWFVKSYLCLYLFAPVLNAFVEKSDKKTFGVFLLSFYIFQTFYAFVFWNGASYLQNGYSALSFMGLYLLARYIRLYPLCIWRLPKWCDMAIYGGIVICTTIISFVLLRHNLPTGNLFYYSSPLVIIAAIHFMLFFTKIQLQNRVINWIASSAFAVYLLHSNVYFASTYYDNIILNWFNELSRSSFLFHTAIFIFVVFFLAICIDKLRIVLIGTILKK